MHRPLARTTRRAALAVSLLATLGGCAATGPMPPLRALDRSAVLGVPAPDDGRVCTRQECRPERNVRYALGKGRTVERRQPALPYVHNGDVYVVPGDAFTLTGDIEGERLVNLRLVKPGEKPAHRISVRFGQAGDGENPLMVLLVDSTLPRALGYQATVVPLGKDEHEPTSTCPVRAGRGAQEAWTFPIDVLVMRDLYLFDPATQHAACK